MKLKIAVIGWKQSGKTSLINTYMEQSECIRSTTADIGVTTLQFADGQQVKELSIYEREFFSYTDEKLNKWLKKVGFHGVILCADLTNQFVAGVVDGYQSRFNEYHNEYQGAVILAGTKQDSRRKNILDEAELHDLCGKRGFNIIETSTKKPAKGVSEVFETLMEQCLVQRTEKLTREEQEKKEKPEKGKITKIKGVLSNKKKEENPVRPAPTYVSPSDTGTGRERKRERKRERHAPSRNNTEVRTRNRSATQGTVSTLPSPQTEQDKEFENTLKRIRTNQENMWLDLTQCRVNPEKAKSLAKAFEQNTVIRSVNLWGNCIGDVGAIAFAEMLKKNATIEEINFWGNSISVEGVTALAEAFKGNSTLMSVNLFGNNIGNGGAQVLAQALEQNRSLSKIVLSYCGITDEGVIAFAEMFGKNKSLHRIDLRGNRIGDQGKQTLREAKGNCIEREINLRRNITHQYKSGLLPRDSDGYEDDYGEYDYVITVKATPVPSRAPEQVQTRNRSATQGSSGQPVTVTVNVYPQTSPQAAPQYPPPQSITAIEALRQQAQGFYTRMQQPGSTPSPVATPPYRTPDSQTINRSGPAAYNENGLIKPDVLYYGLEQQPTITPSAPNQETQGTQPVFNPFLNLSPATASQEMQILFNPFAPQQGTQATPNPFIPSSAPSEAVPLPSRDEAQIPRPLIRHTPVAAMPQDRLHNRNRSATQGSRQPVTVPVLHQSSQEQQRLWANQVAGPAAARAQQRKQTSIPGVTSRPLPVVPSPSVVEPRNTSHVEEIIQEKKEKKVYTDFGGYLASKNRKELVCPITQEPFVDPVLTCDGFAYEREAITRWLVTENKNTDPLTNKPLANKNLTPARQIKSWVQEYHEKFEKQLPGNDKQPGNDRQR